MKNIGLASIPGFPGNGSGPFHIPDDRFATHADNSGLGGAAYHLSAAAMSAHKIKLRVSNPRTIAYFHIKTPFESFSLPGAGPYSFRLNF